VTSERTFFFFRKSWIGETADSALSPDDIDLSYVSKVSILHFSVFSLSQNPRRDAVFKALKWTRKSKISVSFDPTLGVDVWNSTRILRETYSQALRLSHVATFSREEAKFILGTSDPEKACHNALRYGIKIAGTKLGEKKALS